jgi:hypothetical protein
VQYHVKQRDEQGHVWIEFVGKDGTILKISKDGGLTNILGKHWSELGRGTEVTIDIFELPEK